nr:hypothetical protein CJLB15_00092 [Campylobacter phage CJLB-15]
MDWTFGLGSQTIPNQLSLNINFHIIFKLKLINFSNTAFT